MRRLRYPFFAIITLSIATFLTTCADTATGPNDNEEKDAVEYTVNLDGSPTSGGDVSPSDTTVQEGTQLSLRANSEGSHIFTHWSGDVDSTAENPMELTVDQDYSITGNFAIKTYELTVNKDGQGTVTEDILEQKSKEYEHGTVVELTASPSNGWKFVKWQGAITGEQNPAQIKIQEPQEVTAVFEKKSYPLTITINGEGAVDERVVHEKTTDYKYGTKVELTGNPAEGWKFKKWSGAKSNSQNPTNVTVDTTKEITATFEKETYNLSINTEGEGTVTKEPDQSEYERNTEVTLTAQPSGNWFFSSWKGAISGSDNSATVTMNEDKQVSAVFEEQKAKLIRVSNEELQGTPGSSIALKVKTIDQHQNPIGDVQVGFTVVEGNASLESAELRTAENGIAKTTLRLPQGFESSEVEANITSADYPISNEEVMFTANVETKLEKWLTKHSKITKSINWSSFNNRSIKSTVNYSEWSEEQKNDLNRAYLRIVNANLNSENYPPENINEESDNNHGAIFSKGDAWRLYIINIAQSLVLERENRVSWSLLSEDYQREDLDILFDSRSYFRLTEFNGKETYEIKAGGLGVWSEFADAEYPFTGRVMPSHPEIAMDFFREANIMGETRKETIYRLIDWSAVNLVHYAGRFNPENVEDHWGYREAIPVNKIINGTDYTGDNSHEIEHYTAGCHGTNSFYVSILRNLNIPVDYVKPTGHATPHFIGQNMYLSHGDDPYNALFARKPVIHPKKLLITPKTYDKWFTNRSYEGANNNIGRRSVELGVEHLSYNLLGRYCGDKEYDRSKEDGHVFKALERHYTLSELKQMNLWEKMDQKLSKIGGCEEVDRERPPYYDH